jgi:uncharacterized protein (TIGR03437 family)
MMGLFAAAAAAAAQVGIPITLSFSGTGTEGVATASGTLSPFGAATAGMTTVYGTESVTIFFTFHFSNGDTLTATGPADGLGTISTGNAAVTGGAGTFAGATGSFGFTITPINPSDTGPTEFTLTGSGSVVITAAGSGVLGSVACDGSGSTLPINPQSPSGGSAATGSVCSVIICADGVGSTLPISPERVSGVTTPRAASSTVAGCSSLGLDVAEGGSGSTLPILVFEGGGGTLPILVFVGSDGGGSTLPILVFEGGGSTLPVLAETGSGSTLPINPERPATSSAAAPAGTPLEIATPLESIASTYTAVAQCNGAPATCWLTVRVASGTIAASSRAAITAFVNPQGQNPGVYTGNVAITISPAGGIVPPSTLVNVPVTMLVTASQPMLALSQTGVRFQSLNGAGSLAQSIVVANTGPGSLTFTAAASVLSGSNWLSVAPSSGTATASTPAQVTIRANAASLAAGTYFGRVDFSPSGIANATQSVEVALTVLPATATPDATLSTTGLVFVAGKTTPAPQSVQLSNPSSRALTVSANVAMARGTGWLSANASAITAAPAQSLTETVTVNPAGLAPGAYVGTLGFHIAETNTDHIVTILLVVPKTAPCTATQLLPVVTNLEGSFQIAAGFPVPLQAQVVDDCGVPLTAGSVMAYFPLTGDPSTSLIALGQGQWSGTWMPHLTAGGPAAAGIMASGATTAIFGSTGVIGTVAANASAPMGFAGGVVNAASIVVAPIAPGSFFSIFGSNLATALTSQNTFPYPATLGGTQVFLGGEPLPLEVTAGGQINAIIPYDAAVNGVQQLIVQRNGMDSMPETVLLAPAQPAVFTLDQSGKGAGAIVVVKADGTQFVNGPSKPATAGDFLVIYCTGLGAVSPPVAAGAAAPLLTLTSTPIPATVTIGGKPAQVFFSGLTPGYSGLYQVNVLVPPGIAAGANVPVVVSVGGASSPPVTVAIQ